MDDKIVKGKYFSDKICAGGSTLVKAKNQLQIWKTSETKKMPNKMFKCFKLLLVFPKKMKIIYMQTQINNNGSVPLQRA